MDVVNNCTFAPCAYAINFDKATLVKKSFGAQAY